MKELPAQDDLLRPRDHMTVWVRAETWLCPYDRGQVAWLGANTVGPNGRCNNCGVKLVLARSGESVPDPEGLMWCTQCHQYQPSGHAHEPLEAQQPGAPE